MSIIFLAIHCSGDKSGHSGGAQEASFSKAQKGVLWASLSRSRVGSEAESHSSSSNKYYTLSRSRSSSGRTW